MIRTESGLDLTRARDTRRTIIMRHPSQRFTRWTTIETDTNTTLTSFEGALLGLGVGSLETVGEIVGELEGEALGLDEGYIEKR